MVKGLIPILLHKFREEQIRPFFTPRAFQAGKDLQYDPVTGAVSSRADRDLNLIFDGDDEMSTLTLTPSDTVTTAGAQIFGQRMADTLTKERADNDTISTMRNGDSNNNVDARASAPMPAAIAHKPKDGGSIGSGTTTSILSITTEHTINSRMSTIETDYGDMKKELVQILDLLKILASQSAGSYQPTNPPQNVTHANEATGSAKSVPSNILMSTGQAGSAASPGPG
jgi:hypothetical protein